MTDKILSRKASYWLKTKLIFPRHDVTRWILKSTKGIEDFLSCPESSLLAKGWPKPLVQNLRKIKGFSIKKQIDGLFQNEVKALCIEDLKYPSLLKNTADPPPLLFYKGSLNVFLQKTASIVGSRKCSAHGKAFARKISRTLAINGYVVISGLALGIDTAAHSGALECKGATAAILGCGLDITYPASNKYLFDQIEKSGCLISEFPLGEKPLRHNFPKRNRIISGLSEKIIVIEAGNRSGALITANLALEQGREVFAVPGGPSETYSKGCNRLIKDGAFLVDEISDIEFYFNLTNETKRTVSDSPIMNCLEKRPHSLEELEILTQEQAPSLLAKLTELEIEKIIEKNESNKYFLLP